MFIKCLMIMGWLTFIRHLFDEKWFMFIKCLMIYVYQMLNDYGMVDIY